MSGRKNIVILTGFVLSVSLLAVSITAMFLANYLHISKILSIAHYAYVF